MQRYAITDRRSYGLTEHECRHGLLRRVEAWAGGGVEWVQVREKDLAPAALSTLVSEVVKVVAEVVTRAGAEPGAATRVLVNGPPSVAREVGAAGIHLPGGELSALGERVRQARAALGAGAYVSVACHSVDEARAARGAGASVLVFAPVFEKRLRPEGRALPGAGLAMLREVCAAAAPLPVLALGGVTNKNAAACFGAGAAGVAGIRLFAGDAWRGLGSDAE